MILSSCASLGVKVSYFSPYHLHHSSFRSCLSATTTFCLQQVRGLLRAIVGDLQPERCPERSRSLAKSTGGGGPVGDGTAGEDGTGGDGTDDGSSCVGEERTGEVQGAMNMSVHKTLPVLELESKLDVGGEVVETVLSMLEGEPYRYNSDVTINSRPLYTFHQSDVQVRWT